MKKVVRVLVGLLMMTTAAYAATAAPEFNDPVKVADGKIRGTNNKVAVDGTTVYAAYEVSNLDVLAPFHVGKSINSGATWGLSAIPDQTSVGNGKPVRVAVGIDPVYSGQKIVHTVWVNESGDVMYSYFATRPTQTGWSTPVRINGSHLFQDELDLVATSDGALHVLIDNTYSMASTPDSIFTEPETLPADGLGSIVKDAQNNLYVALSDGVDIKLTKKAAGSSNWSTPVTVTATGSAIADRIGLAIADANTYYIGYSDMTTSEVELAVTTDGGNNWIRRSVLSLPIDYDTGVGVAVTSTKILTLVASTGFTAEGNRILKVVRTKDNGETWSSAVTIQGDDAVPMITLDASNKAMILVRDGQGGQDWSGVRTNSNANLLFLKEK